MRELIASIFSHAIKDFYALLGIVVMFLTFKEFSLPVIYKLIILMMIAVAAVCLGIWRLLSARRKDGESLGKHQYRVFPGSTNQSARRKGGESLGKFILVSIVVVLVFRESSLSRIFKLITVMVIVVVAVCLDIEQHLSTKRKAREALGAPVTLDKGLRKLLNRVEEQFPLERRHEIILIRLFPSEITSAMVDAPDRFTQKQISRYRQWVGLIIAEGSDNTYSWDETIIGKIVSRIPVSALTQLHLETWRVIEEDYFGVPAPPPTCGLGIAAIGLPNWEIAVFSSPLGHRHPTDFVCGLRFWYDQGKLVGYFFTDKHMGFEFYNRFIGLRQALEKKNSYWVFPNDVVGDGSQQGKKRQSIEQKVGEFLVSVAANHQSPS